jgi:CheY-like chemotaxis protein
MLCRVSLTRKSARFPLSQVSRSCTEPLTKKAWRLIRGRSIKNVSRADFRQQAQLVHILIADDHKAVRDNLRSFLNEQQPYWEVSEASNWQEAIDLFRKTTPDVAVLDIVMMPVGGVAAAYEIRRINPDAKVVFISGHYAPVDYQAIVKTKLVRSHSRKRADGGLVATDHRVE